MSVKILENLKLGSSEPYYCECHTWKKKHIDPKVTVKGGKTDSECHLHGAEVKESVGVFTTKRWNGFQVIPSTLHLCKDCAEAWAKYSAEKGRPFFEV